MEMKWLFDIIDAEKKYYTNTDPKLVKYDAAALYALNSLEKQIKEFIKDTNKLTKGKRHENS